jgi:lipoprotein-releasing system permease protein
MRNGDVRKIFLWRAALLYAKGALWGNLTGLALVAVQWLWSPVKLDPSGYILSELPVRVDLWWLVLLNVAILAVTMLTMVVP